jgi:hypothetical protein
MSLLANATIAIAKVTVDSAPARDVVRIVRAGQGRTFGDTEVRLNGVEPGGLGRRPHGVNVQPPEQRQEPRVIVDVVEVIHDDEQPASGITRPLSTAAHREPPGVTHMEPVWRRDRILNTNVVSFCPTLLRRRVSGAR